MKPDITVCIPAFNGEEYLLRAVESCCLEDNPWLNVLVIDNASSDRTVLICEQLAKRFENFRFLSFDEHLCATGNFNRCIHHCDTTFLVFLCCDDLVIPEGLKKAHLEITKNREIGFVCSSVLCVEKSGKVFRQNPSGKFLYTSSLGLSLSQKHDLLSHGVSIPGLLCKKELFNDVSFSSDTELITEFVIPHLFVEKAEFIVLDADAGVFLPRKGSNYSGPMADKVTSDFLNGLALIEERMSIVRKSSTISNSFARNLLRNTLRRGPLSFKQSICLLRAFRNCFSRIPLFLYLGVFASFILKRQGFGFDRITGILKRQKYMDMNTLSPSSIAHCRKFISYLDSGNHFAK